MVGSDEGEKDEKANGPHRKDNAGILDQRKKDTGAGRSMRRDDKRSGLTAMEEEFLPQPP